MEKLKRKGGFGGDGDGGGGDYSGVYMSGLCASIHCFYLFLMIFVLFFFLVSILLPFSAPIDCLLVASRLLVAKMTESGCLIEIDIQENFQLSSTLILKFGVFLGF